MSYRSLLIRSIKISRKTQVSGFKYAFSTTTASVCSYMPLSLDESQLVEGVFGKTFKIWFDAAEDIQEGDRVRDTDTGDRFIIKGFGVATRSMGSIEYKVAVAEQVAE